MQRARLRAARPFLLSNGGPTLDVGCGLTDLPGSIGDYVGCDRHPEVLAACRARFPRARFLPWDVAASVPPPAVVACGPYASILVLALLEHLASPGEALARMAPLLAEGGRVILTTPHPWARFPLEAGAALRLLSRHAAGEHETLLGRSGLGTIAREAGLIVTAYRRFLLGLNQVAVLERTVH